MNSKKATDEDSADFFQVGGRLLSYSFFIYRGTTTVARAGDSN